MNILEQEVKQWSESMDKWVELSEKQLELWESIAANVKKLAEVGNKDTRENRV